MKAFAISSNVGISKLAFENYQNDPDKYVKAWKAVLADSNMVANVLR